MAQQALWAAGPAAASRTRRETTVSARLTVVSQIPPGLHGYCRTDPVVGASVATTQTTPWVRSQAFASG